MDIPKQHTPFEAIVNLTSFLPKARKFHITADKSFSNLNQAELLEQQGHFFTLNCKTNSQSTKLWQGGLGVGLPLFRSRFVTKNNIVAGAYQSKSKLHILFNFFTITETTESKGKERGVLLHNIMTQPKKQQITSINL